MTTTKVKWPLDVIDLTVRYSGVIGDHDFGASGHLQEVIMNQLWYGVTFTVRCVWWEAV